MHNSDQAYFGSGTKLTVLGKKEKKQLLLFLGFKKAEMRCAGEISSSTFYDHWYGKSTHLVLRYGREKAVGSDLKPGELIKVLEDL